MLSQTKYLLTNKKRGFARSPVLMYAIWGLVIHLAMLYWVMFH